MARTAHQAVSEYLERLQRIRSCITQEIFSVAGGYYETGEQPHALLLAGGGSVRLSGSYAIRLMQNYLVLKDPDGTFRVSTAAYFYALEESDGRELLAFHYHPATPPTYPHVHLGAAAGVQNRQLAEAHIPTGRVSVEAFFRLVLNDFALPALRPDWQQILGETEALFRSERTWS